MIDLVFKSITALITSLIALIIGIRVYILNRKEWTNRWFALFFISTSLGFLIYTTYHLILNNASIIIPLMITAHFFFNFVFISLVMTVFVLEKYAKIAMSMKYLGTLLIIFIIMCVGYFIPIFRPYLNTIAYGEGRVDTITPDVWLYTVNAFRIVLGIYVFVKYIIMANKIEGESRNRIRWFSMGVIIVILGLIANLFGGALHSIILEIVALLIINVGAILILKGFLI